MIYDRANDRELYLDGDILPSTHVNDMAIDREGKMWVATDRGVVYFINAENILDQGLPDPVQPIFDGQLLFRNEKITALAVDGGNRTWMATTSGLWLFAFDGQQLVEEHNLVNSPLPSTNILDLALNFASGELFIVTDKGLVSYRGTSTIAGKKSPLKIFPNPAILSRHNVITIEGVAENADVWVTDASGRLVFKTRANGNTAVWPGLAANRSLSSGVYFVFTINEAGEEKQVGKIALVN